MLTFFFLVTMDETVQQHYAVSDDDDVDKESGESESELSSVASSIVGGGAVVAQQEEEEEPTSLSSIVCEPVHPRIRREIMELPTDELSKVAADLAGISMRENNNNTEFFPCAVVEKLGELVEELSLIPDEEKEVYNFVSSIDLLKIGGPEEYLNAEFLLKFLRCEDFNAKKAAQRLVRHFEKKMELFGDGVLHRDIKLSDLSDDELVFLQTGCFQILPSLDRANRVVWFGRHSEYKHKSSRNMMRMVWYMCMATSEIPESQLNGVAVISYEINNAAPKENDYDENRQRIETFECVPLKLCAAHLCFDGSSKFWQTLYDVIVNLVSPFLRMRICYHTGEFCKCTMQCFVYSNVNMSF